MKNVGWIEGKVKDEEIAQISRLLQSFREPPIVNLEDMPDRLQLIMQDRHQTLNKFMERLISEVKEGEKFRLIWQADLRLNAFALRSTFLDVNIIGINIGCILTLSWLFMRLFASPTFCPEIGDPSLEKSENRILVVGGEVLPAENSHQRSPNCPIRNTVAHLVASLALEFLFLHELTHITNGHNAIGKMITERPEEDPLDKRIINHTLEMDADAGAVRRAFQMLMLGAFSANPDYRGNPRYSPELESAQRAMGTGSAAAARMLLLATTGLFLLFQGGILTEQTMFRGKHPHTIIRQIMIRGVLANIISSVEGNDAANRILRKLSEIHKEFYKEIDFGEDFHHIGASVDRFLESGLYEKYVDVLADCWRDQLHEELSKRKISKIALAPPREFKS